MMLLIVCISCSEKYDDNKYFNGDIRKIEDNSGVVRKIALKSVVLNGPNYGYIALYDSLMFF